MINDKKIIPGCETFTRPEEIQALSKYLGHIRKTQEEYVGLDDTTLIVPGKDTGQLPELNELPDEVEKLDVGPDVKLPGSILPVPDLKGEPELSDYIESLDGVEDLGIDLKKYGEADKLKVDSIKELPEDVLPVEGNIPKPELENTTLKLEDTKETELEETVLGLEIPVTDKTKLEETVIGLEDNNREPRLSDTILNLENTPKDVKLGETVVEIEDNRKTVLGETKEGLIGTPKKIELSDTLLKIADEKRVELDNTRLEIKDDRNLKLGDEIIDLNDDRKVELREERLGLRDERNTELEETRINLYDNTETNLEETKIKLVVDVETKLVEDKIELTDDREPEIGNERLGLGYVDDKEIELSDTRIDLTNNSENEELELGDILVDLQDNREPELSDKIIGLDNTRDIDGLGETIIDLSVDKNVELPDKVVNLQDERKAELGEEILRKPQNQGKEEVSEVEKKIIGGVENQNPNGEVEGLYDDYLLLSQNESEKSLKLEGLKRKEDLDNLYTEVGLPEDQSLSALYGFEPEVEYLEDGQKKLLADESEKSKAIKDAELLGEIEKLYLTKNDNEFYNGVMALLWDIGQYKSLSKNKVFEQDKEKLIKNSLYLDNVDNIRHWQEKVASLVTAYLSSSSISPKRAEEYMMKLEEATSLYGYTKSLGGNTGEVITTPEYQLPGDDGISLSVSRNLRNIAEKSQKLHGKHGSARRQLLEETLWLLVVARDAAEELTHTSRSSLPGYIGPGIASIVHERNVGEVIENTAIGTAKDVASQVLGLNPILNGSSGHSSPINYPTKKTTGFQLGNNRDEGGTKIGNWKQALKSELKKMIEVAKSSVIGNLGLGSNQYSFADNYLVGTGIQTTLRDLCYSSNPRSVEDLYDTLKSSPYITTPTKFGTIERGLYRSQTLDTNAYWEVILEPFCNKEMNGGFSYLPAIQEINAVNIQTHGVNTGYNTWIPINGFELQKSKVGTKSLGLYDGEINYPITVEFTNEVRLTIVDDQYKSWRRYFETCAACSVYNSEPHDSNYYLNAYEASQGSLKPTKIDKSSICIALYKNVAFRCQIYVMTPQYSTIKKYDLLLVMKDFSEEYSGDIDASANDLTVSFSIVGENPKEDTNAAMKWVSTGLQSFVDKSALKKAEVAKNTSSKISKALSLL